MMALLESTTVFNFALGTFFGMLIWDLAFETRSLASARDVEMVRSYYEGLQTAKPVVLLVLLLAVVLPLAHLVVKTFWGPGGAVAPICLGLFVAALVVEFVLALPNENRLLKELGSPAEADESTLEKMKSCVVKARNAHLVMVVALLIVGLLNSM